MILAVSSIISVFVGLLLAVQNPINAKVSFLMKSPIKASFVSYVISLVAILIASIVMGQDFGYAFSLFNSKDAGIFYWCGGFFGAFYVTSNIMLFPRIGAIQTVMLPTLGQIVSGVLIDSFGLFGSDYIPMNLGRIIGLAVLILGIYIAVALIKGEDNTGSMPGVNKNFWRIEGFFAGVASTMQSTLNGHLGQVINSGMIATLVALITGASLVFVFVLINGGMSFKEYISYTFSKLPFYAGIIGAIFVAAMTFLIPILGPGLVVSITIVGIMIGSCCVQQFGMFDSPKAKVQRNQVLGIILMIVGIVILKFM